MKGCLYIIRGAEKKLMLPVSSVTIKSDGTIWFQGMPIIGITDPAAKAVVVELIKDRKYEDIPTDAYTRLGDNPNGLWAGDDKAWSKHPVKIAADEKKAIKATEQAKRVTIYLSSRGWGDYSPCEWIGDITRPDTEILAECRAELVSGYDVDESKQSDEQILNKIIAAREKWAGREEREKATEEAMANDIQNKIGTGYCFSCETWCHGDCGHYSNNPHTKFRRDFREMQREQNYGVED